jgi:hypothetical protein
LEARRSRVSVSTVALVTTLSASNAFAQQARDPIFTLMIDRTTL